MFGYEEECKAREPGVAFPIGEYPSDKPEYRPLNMESASIQEYDDQAYQDIYYIADSFQDMMEKFRLVKSCVIFDQNFAFCRLQSLILILDKIYVY